MTYQVSHFINGEIVSTGERKTSLYNPAVGDVIGQVIMADKAMVDRAVLNAKEVYPVWSQLSPLRRARILFKYKLLLEDHIDELAELITREQGKTLADAKGSIQRGIDVVEYACGITNHLKGTYSENVATDIDTYSIRQPLGVCVGITPFNFPAMIALWMFPIAIACGNTFILKPSEKDPSCSLRLAELAKEAGVLDGVINIIQGDKEAVDALLTHPDIKAVSFVGSTATAEYVQQTAISHGKRVQAFGGAKNHAVIMPDADLDQVADAIVGAAFGSAGERCMAISVVLAVGDVTADHLIEKMLPRIHALKIGPGILAETEMGPLVTESHWNKVKEYINLGVNEGAKLIVDGRDYRKDAGFYMGPCLFDHVTPSMRIYREEIFGPVLSIVRVENLRTAIALINQHEYGNGTAIFTRDGHAARTFATNIEVGMVGINIPIPVPPGHHSFGGWKRSVFADIHMHGPEGVMFYTKLKTVTQRWVNATQGAQFIMPTH